MSASVRGANLKAGDGKALHGVPITPLDREEAKKRKMAAQAGHESLFAPKKKPKPSNSTSLVTKFNQMVHMNPPSTIERKSKPSDEKYTKFVSMASRGSKFSFPFTQELKQYDSDVAELEQLKQQRPPPYQALIELKKKISEESARLSSQITDVADAVDAYHTSTSLQQKCLESDDFETAALWAAVQESLSVLGIADWLKEEMSRREEAAKAAQAQAQAEAAEASAAQANPEQVIELDGSPEEQEAAMTTDKAGNKVRVDSIMQVGKLSNRDKAVKAKVSV